MTEFEILKNTHRFLRDEDDTRNESWDEQLASKYYASLYREFAVCDLKHYKSGNFALRWRTESEVLSGAGETTCGNTRCEHHLPLPEYLRRSAGPAPPLTTMELPFAYEEHGENKSALVKVVLCPRCFDRLLWKRRKEKGKAVEADAEDETEQTGPSECRTQEDRKTKDGTKKTDEEVTGSVREERHRSIKHRDDRRRGNGERRRRSSRSQSPRTNHLQHNPPSRRHRQPEREHQH
ncbi:hypothetical protein C0991_009981 [Blastosporella zonata]|nr:hypothetical protein C0991_009981 [Blastosporella zonata]